MIGALQRNHFIFFEFFDFWAFYGLVLVTIVLVTKNCVDRSASKDIVQSKVFKPYEEYLGKTGVGLEKSSLESQVGCIIQLLHMLSFNGQRIEIAAAVACSMAEANSSPRDQAC